MTYKAINKLSPSQHDRQKKKQRLEYLRAELNKGRVPQPRKEITPEIKQLYRERGVDKAVYMLEPWMDDDLRERVKTERRKLRRAVRDRLPADTPQKFVSIVFGLVLSGELSLDDLNNHRSVAEKANKALSSST